MVKTLIPMQFTSGLGGIVNMCTPLGKRCFVVTWEINIGEKYIFFPPRMKSFVW
jgi:hypothetical protein